VLFRSSLGRLVGIAGTFDIKETAAVDAVAPGTMVELKNMALTRRIELKSLELQKTMAEKQVSYVKSAFWPDLSLGAAYARLDNYPQQTTFNRESTYGSVGLNFPLYDSGFRRADVMEAEAKLRQADLLYRDAVKTVNLEVENSYLDYTTQQGIIKFLQDQLTYAQDNYSGVSKQYEFGLANSIDVIDANNLLLTSQRQLADAVLSSHYYLLVLKRVSGTLLGDVADIKQ
jgi:outer membrane protein